MVRLGETNKQNTGDPGYEPLAGGRPPLGSLRVQSLFARLLSGFRDRRFRERLNLLVRQPCLCRNFGDRGTSTETVHLHATHHALQKNESRGDFAVTELTDGLIVLRCQKVRKNRQDV